MGTTNQLLQMSHTNSFMNQFYGHDSPYDMPKEQNYPYHISMMSLHQESEQFGPESGRMGQEELSFRNCGFEKSGSFESQNLEGKSEDLDLPKSQQQMKPSGHGM